MGVIRSYLLFSRVTKEKIDKEFVSTLETMRELAIAARLKRPKTSNGINTSRLRPICELCGQPTELEIARQREYLDDSIGNSRISARYCVVHRSRNHDGTYNADYKRALRNKNKFESELARLSRQAAKVSEACANTGDTAVDLFILNVVARRALYPDEASKLREIARQLVERSGGVSDSKKRIVILLASGMTQSDVATYLNISRQAVSKAIRSIPSEYRFDKLRTIN